MVFSHISPSGRESLMKVRVWGKVFNFSMMSVAKNEIKPSFIISWLSIKVMNRRLRSAI